MRISVGSDHRGRAMRQQVIDLLEELGHEPIDSGTFDDERVDYPDFAMLVARQVSTRIADRGILICGTGIGMSIAANKFPGIRAAVVNHHVASEMSRRHNDINIACFGADLVSPEDLPALLRTFLDTPFDGGRHARRLAKIAVTERDDQRPDDREPDDREPGDQGKQGKLGSRVPS